MSSMEPMLLSIPTFLSILIVAAIAFSQRSPRAMSFPFGAVCTQTTNIDASVSTSALSRPSELVKLLAAFPSTLYRIFAVRNASEDVRMVRHIRTLAKSHETASVLAVLIDRDGAGTWPPNSNHDSRSWPTPLQPYAEIYREVCSQLATSEPSLDNDVNLARIHAFRARFRTLLQTRVDVERVNRLLRRPKSDRAEDVSPATYNAFYCCIATCRHAYR